jgi:cytochrome c2
MKNTIFIFGFTILVTLFYRYVGNEIPPQKEAYPPKDIEIRPDLTTEEMVEVGEKIFADKGTCLTCHAFADRAPNLDGIGARSGSRIEGYSDIEYLAESIYEPNAYVVEGFLPGMTPARLIGGTGLTDQEVLTLIAYLQSRGGTPTVTMETTFKWQGQAQPAVPEQTTMSAQEKAARQLFVDFGCITCHALDTPDKMLGPSLMDVGARLTPEEIEESIMDPDAKITEGFELFAGQMKMTLTTLGVYDKLTPENLKTLVDFLASKKGN